MESLNTDSVETGGTVKRLLINDSDTTITVGTDTNGWGDIQDLLPLVYQEPSVVVSVPEGDWTGSDFTVPPVIEPEDPGAPLLIEGNATTPSKCKVGGLMISGTFGKRPILVRGIQFEEPHNLADSNSLVQVEGGAGTVILEDCNFRDPAGNNPQRCITVYGGNLYTKGTIDIGTDVFPNFVTVKNQGKFFDGTVDSGGDVVGSVTSNLYSSQNATQCVVDSQVSAWKGVSGLNANRTPITVYDSANNEADRITYGSGLFLQETNTLIQGDKTTVGTTATKIANLGARGGLMLVTGRDGAATDFADLVLYVANNSAVVVNNVDDSNAASRTYNVSGSDMELSMASGTYTIRALNVEGATGIQPPFQF